MKKIIVWLFLIFLIFSSILNAQENNNYTKNCIYLELLGQGILGSVNYEYRFSPNWSGRVGFTTESIFIPIGLDIDITGSPIMINFLTGHASHHFEMGLGVFAAWVKGDDFWGMKMDTDEEFMPLYTATIGYRHQPRTTGFIYKLGFTPLFNGDGEGSIWAGLSLGYTF